MPENDNPHLSTRLRLSPAGRSAGKRMACITRISIRAKPKHYALTMLPYPSGDLHIGHWYAMTPSDARARYHAHARVIT